MMSIDKLIYDALAGRRRVVLPGVGTLEVTRRGAKKISETRILSPQSVVAFTSDEADGAESVVSLVAAATGVGEGEAAALYGSWLEAARRDDGSLFIDGVGEVRGGAFVASESFHAALNPAGEEVVEMAGARGRIPAWVWWVIATLVALLLFCTFRCCKDGGLLRRPDKPKVETVASPIPDSASDASASDASAAASGDAASGAASAVPVSGERFHVIAGAFSIESNADKFIAKVKRDLPELTPLKLVNPDNGYHMVSIIQAATERAARSKMNLYWDVSLNLWIYEQK